MDTRDRWMHADTQAHRCCMGRWPRSRAPRHHHHHRPPRQTKKGTGQVLSALGSDPGGKASSHVAQPERTFISPTLANGEQGPDQGEKKGKGKGRERKESREQSNGFTPSPVSGKGRDEDEGRRCMASNFPFLLSFLSCRPSSRFFWFLPRLPTSLFLLPTPPSLFLSLFATSSASSASIPLLSSPSSRSFQPSAPCSDSSKECPALPRLAPPLTATVSLSSA